jgi:hypothetical protein
MSQQFERTCEVSRLNAHSREVRERAHKACEHARELINRLRTVNHARIDGARLRHSSPQRSG